MLNVVRYYCSPNATVADAVSAYDQSYCGQSSYASRPLPHYLEQLGIDDVADGVQDVCYHLIRLYCDRTHSLHVLLSTTAITDNPLDYSLRFVDLSVSSLCFFHLSTCFLQWIDWIMEGITRSLVWTHYWDTAVK